MIKAIEKHAQRGSYGPKLDISEEVLQAMRRVPRHEYVRDKKTAYWDQPCPIECEQTISKRHIERVYLVGTSNGCRKSYDKLLQIKNINKDHTKN